MISSRFIQLAGANVRYWLQQTADAQDTTLRLLDRERHNLQRAVAFGLQLDETRAETAVLVSQLFPLIERRGYWRDWEPMLRRAIAASAAQPDLQLALRNQLGFLQRLQRQLPEAIQTHLDTIARARQRGSDLALANGSFHLGNAYYDNRQFDEAEAATRSALAQFQQLQTGDRALKLAAVHNLLGLIAVARGDYRAAITYYQQAIPHWRKTAELTYLARTLNNLGIAHSALQAYQEALTCYAQADAVLDQTVSELDRVRVAINRGNVFVAQANWPAAEEAYRQANSPYLLQSEDTFHQALIANNLGYVLIQQGAWRAAEACLRESVALWREVKDDLMLANALGNLGQVLLHDGDVTTAGDAFTEALALCRRHPDAAFGRVVEEGILATWSETAVLPESPAADEGLSPDDKPSRPV